MQLTNLIKEIANTEQSTDNAAFGYVVEIYEDGLYCSVELDDGYSLDNIRIIPQKVANQDGTLDAFRMVPKLGSLVGVVITEHTTDTGFIALFSQVQQISWQVNDASLEEGGEEKATQLASTVINAAGINHHVKNLDSGAVNEIRMTAEAYKQASGNTTITIDNNQYEQISGNATLTLKSDGVSFKSNEVELKTLLEDMLGLFDNLITSQGPVEYGDAGIQANLIKQKITSFFS